MASQIIALNWKNNNIAQRESDGYVNLTQMCKASGKKVNDFFRLKETKSYIRQLSIDTGIPVSEIFSIKKGGDVQQGTWGHPLLALNLARWISAEFAVWCDSHIFVLMTTGKTDLGIDPLQTTMQLLKENYQEISENNEIDDRFLTATNYSHWAK
jgi:hypothetical protein